MARPSSQKTSPYSQACSHLATARIVIGNSTSRNLQILNFCNCIAAMQHYITGKHNSSLVIALNCSPSNLLPERWGFFLPMHLPQYICDLDTAIHRFPFYVGFKLPSVSSPSAGVFSLKILIVFWSVRTAHRKFTAANINDLGAGNVFTPTATASCRLLNRIHGNIPTVLCYQVFDGNFPHMTAQTI